MDGNQICATWDDFDCLAVSPAGFGNNLTEAVLDLIKETKPYEINKIISDIENNKTLEEKIMSGAFALSAGD